MKIVVVEDDDLYRTLIDKALTRAGHAVEAYANGDAAIEAVFHNSFDILITDMVMPGTEGIELVAEIKQSRPAVKILAISGSGIAGHTSYLAVAQAHGADAILEKPFTPDQLLEKIAFGDA